MNDNASFLCLAGLLTLLIFSIFIGANRVMEKHEIQEERLDDEERNAVGFQTLGCGIAALLNVALPISLSQFFRLPELPSKIISYAAAVIGVVLVILVAVNIIRHRVFSIHQRDGSAYYYRGGCAIFTGIFLLMLAGAWGCQIILALFAK